MKHFSLAFCSLIAALTVAASADPVIGTDGIARYRYGGNSAPTLHCAPLIVCDIQLAADETIKTPPVAGDTVQWIIRVGQGAQPYIYVKPVSAGLRTNLIVVTSKREYHINLVSNETVSHTSLGFYYPSDPSTSGVRSIEPGSMSESAQINAAISTAQVETADYAPPLTANGTPLVDPLHLDHGYDVTGEAVFKPVAVFNDGTRTYIQLPEHLTEIPVIIGYDTAGLEQVINYENYGGYYILNSLYPRMGLVLGTGRDRHAIMITKKGRG
jgi:type IV secretion system protein VirB9